MTQPNTPRRQDGAAIRRLREQRGWFPRDLAERVGLHPGSLSHIEANRTQASPERLHRIAAALDVKVEEILSDRGRRELVSG